MRAATLSDGSGQKMSISYWSCTPQILFTVSFAAPSICWEGEDDFSFD